MQPNRARTACPQRCILDAHLVHVYVRTDGADVLRLATGTRLLSTQTQTDVCVAPLEMPLSFTKFCRGFVQPSLRSFGLVLSKLVETRKEECPGRLPHPKKGSGSEPSYSTPSSLYTLISEYHKRAFESAILLMEMQARSISDGCRYERIYRVKFLHVYL
jgi:hypothetical protein